MKQGTTTYLIGLVALLGGVVACEAPQPQLSEAKGQSSDKIIGGTTDTGHLSTGILRTFTSTTPGGVFSTCTATVIAPRVLVTAGHCSADSNLVPIVVVDVSFDTVPDLSANIGEGSFTSGKIFPNPKYNGTSSDGNDVSVVVLDTPVNAPAIGFGNAPAAGSLVTAVGFGRNVFVDNEGAGTRRQVTIPVIDVFTHEFTLGTATQGTCHGDSGGPVFQNNLMVGLVSYNPNADCTGFDHMMRADDNLDFFQQFIDSPDTAPNNNNNNNNNNGGWADSGGGGDQCSVAIQCNNNVCQCSDSNHAGVSCDGNMGSANSCDAICSSCGGAGGGGGGSNNGDNSDGANGASQCNGWCHWSDWGW